MNALAQLLTHAIYSIIFNFVYLQSYWNMIDFVAILNRNNYNNFMIEFGVKADV